MLYGRVAALFGICLLAACAAPARGGSTSADHFSCSDRATQIISANAASVAAHQYDAASRNAEHAARVSLECARISADPVERFSDRWRGANALVVSAELAHEANQYPRAHALLREGYAIMHNLQPPNHVSEITSTLIAQKLDGARHDMAGHWIYW
jgi:hypothetical protein